MVCTINHGLLGQDTTYQQLYELEYAQRITKPKINGRYIPKDLQETMVELDKLVDMVGKAKFKAQSEDIAVRNIHFSFGKWMIVNWSFYEGSRLSHYLKGQGISHPDDMASTLMRCYHRHLNNRPLDFEALATACAEKRKAEMEKRLRQGQIIETKTVPKN